MGNTDAERVQDREAATTFISPNLSGVLQEISDRLACANLFVTFFRSSNLLTQANFYRDAAKTNLAIKRNYTRVTGATGLSLINTIVTTYYELDGVTVDSQVSSFLSRDLTVSGEDYIQSCSSYFSTTETLC